MTYHSYLVSRELAKEDHPIDSLIMAAMRKADHDHLTKLQLVFPHYWEELQERYQAPGGLLPKEWGDGMEPVQEFRLER